VLAIVPVNGLADGKRRLAPILPAPERAQLVRAMLEDVLQACRIASAIERTLVVTPDPDLARTDAEVLRDPGRGHAEAIRLALSRAPDGALVVMADCPLVTATALDALAAAARPVALSPAQDGGTNALALRPADAVEPAFGVGNGASVVVERARSAGLEVAVLDDPGLALDVDTPEDLERVLELGRGTRTHEFLRVSDVVPSLLR
jgi:2-phospho-L-lactate guanylyltransferase